ncbi:MAG: hypothetical protein OR994_00635 [Candidatus Poseidoniales archaeon]|nr:hypothetical protein [SAR202 cluster bacterium]MDE0953160.1 hypothetical protein [Candidatus Poseidoniales archaeon]
MNEIFWITGWMLGDQESRNLLRVAEIKNITITVRDFNLADIAT